MNRYGVIFGLVMLLVSCSGKEPPLDQYDAQGLMERGLAAHAAEEWDDAIRYFDRMALEYPLHPRVEEARFYLADAYLQQEEYVAAAGRFARLVEDFPRGEYADDARFKVCAAYRELSPEPTLDQEYTRAAIDHCQALLVYHPESEYAGRAQEVLQAMRDKLARKELLTGEFYMKRRAYDSAIIFFENVVATYPQSMVAAEALLRMAESYEAIGYDDEAEAARDRLLREYPQSDAARRITALR